MKVHVRRTIAKCMGIFVMLSSSQVVAYEPGALEREGTRIDSLSAVRAGGVVQVSGMATFVDSPAVVGIDPVGDALVPGVGTDLV